jgi:LysR family transcriptional regulator, glycine cleavage system transcriptional activator
MGFIGMRRQLPPFRAVRAFEASARHLSFKKAAQELCLTQSAISHQIKVLEEYLGVQLFYRESRGVVLTRDGSNYLVSLTEILDRMAAETARISKREIAGSLSVRAAPGFVRWLVPRLASFQKEYSDIDLHLSGSLVLPDFASEDVDVNIRWGFEPKPGLLTTPLMASTRYPVISPESLSRGPVLERPRDLRRHTLLHEGFCPNFEKWFDYAGVSVDNSRPGFSFANYDHVLQAAVEGQGVALGFDVIVANDIASGRLVRLFDVRYPERILYSLVTPGSWAERPRIAAFRSWLMRQTGALAAANHLQALCAAEDISVHARP